jgi:hypothetical protein
MWCRGRGARFEHGLHCALVYWSVAVVERHAAGRRHPERRGLFKSVQADELRTRLARRSIEKAASFAYWAGAVGGGPAGSLIARTAQHRICAGAGPVGALGR